MKKMKKKEKKKEERKNWFIIHSDHSSHKDGIAINIFLKGGASVRVCVGSG